MRCCCRSKDQSRPGMCKVVLDRENFSGEGSYPEICHLRVELVSFAMRVDSPNFEDSESSRTSPSHPFKNPQTRVMADEAFEIESEARNLGLSLSLGLGPGSSVCSLPYVPSSGESRRDEMCNWCCCVVAYTSSLSPPSRLNCFVFTSNIIASREESRSNLCGIEVLERSLTTNNKTRDRLISISSLSAGWSLQPL